MNLVFLNSLEKSSSEGDNRVVTAQVSIGEHHGKWHVLWNEPGREGKVEQESWYEGHQWEEMLKVFRYRLTEKTLEGFIPLLGNALEEQGFTSGKSKHTQMLHYYSDLHSREEVYEQLRLWRREQSTKEGKAPFIVASNRVLRMISTFVPKSKEELLQIPGFGQNKVNLYGEDVLQLTMKIERSKGFPLDWVAQEIDEQHLRVWVYQQRELKVRNELDKQKLKQMLLEGVSRGTGLTDLQRETNVPRRELVQWIEQLDNEGYDLDSWLEAELQVVPLSEQEQAMKAFEEEGDRYLKPVLKRIGFDGKSEDANHVYEWLRLLRLRFRKEKGTRHQAS